MAFDPELQIERDGDTLIVRAKTASYERAEGAAVAIVGVLFVVGALAGFCLIKNQKDFNCQGARQMVYIVLGGALAACGVFAILPRVITTTFDPRPRLVVCSTRWGNRSPKTNRYSFEEIAGIYLALREISIGTTIYFPSLKLKGSRRLRLVCSGLTLSAAEKLMEAVSAATGLPQLDEWPRPRVHWLWRDRDAAY